MTEANAPIAGKEVAASLQEGVPGQHSLSGAVDRMGLAGVRLPYSSGADYLRVPVMLAERFPFWLCTVTVTVTDSGWSVSGSSSESTTPNVVNV